MRARAALCVLAASVGVAGAARQDLSLPQAKGGPQRAISVDDIAKVRDIDSLGVSPDGSRVALFVRQGDSAANRYRTGWLVAHVETGALVWAGDGGDLGPKVMPTGHMPGIVAGSESRWSPGGKGFAYTLVRNGETQLWRSDVEGRQVQVTRNAADVRDFAWSTDGRSLYFTVGTPREEHRAREELRARAGYRYDHDLWGPYDLLLPKTIVPPESRLSTWVAPLDGQPERLATEAEQREFVRARAPKGADASAVPPALRTEGDEFEKCTAAPRDRLICVRQSVLRPPHLVSVDLRAGSVAVIADPNPEFKDIKLGKAERFEWDLPRFAWNEPGGKLEGLYPTRSFGWLILPPDFNASRKYPVFIDPYVATGFRPLGFEHALHAYAANGIVVLRLALPTPIDHWKRLGPSAMRQLYSEELGFPHLTMLMASTLAGLDAIAARGFIDPTRVGIGGVSHGTFVPMYLLQKHDRIAAISISSPGWGPHSYYSGTQLSREWMAKAGYESWAVKPEGAGREFWRQIDLSDHVDEIEAPILMHLAAHEAYGQVPLIRHLADAGKPYDAYIFPRETHIKWQPAHLRAIMERNLDWFRFWLQDHEDASPDKAEQYARWRELRILQCRNPRRATRSPAGK